MQSPRGFLAGALLTGEDISC